MTANASHKGRPPLQLPSPPQKPMPAGHRKGKRASCLGLSCFGGSSVADSDSGPPTARRRRAPCFTWSKFQKKKKTVPVDSSATELIPEKATTGDSCRPQAAGVDKSAGKDGRGAEEEEPRKQQRQDMAPTKTLLLPPVAVEFPSQSFLWRIWKGNKDRGGHKTQLSRSHKDQVLTSNHKRQQRPPPPQQQHRIPPISPRYDSRRRVPAPFPPEPARTATTLPRAPRTAPPSSPAASPATTKSPPNHATTTSRLGGARSHKKREEPSSTSSSSGLPAGRNDQVVGLSVMVVMLIMMLLFGRVSAVIVTCLWFYCLPRLRATLTETNGGGSKSSAGVDFDSEEYKKKVVLEGLLQRNARRPPGLP